MSTNREEEFELVLGNKQLLSLFFIVVGFFAAFFSVGYMVGFGHGEKTGASTGIAKVEQPAPQPKEPSLPATLMQEPPPEPPAVATAPKPSPVEEVAPKPSTKPEPTQTATAKPPEPKQTAPEKPAAVKPSPTSSSTPKVTPRPAPAPKPATTEAGYYLQVAAVRVAADAAELAGQLKSKGYPATVSAGKGDGWQRVVVGPFSSSEAAQQFKQRLTKDGFDTMLRKL
ncbi:MAG: SPOR domain-containing protein [Bryobacterales bacterium]